MIQKTFDSEYTRIKSIPNLLSYNMDQNNQWHFVYKLSKSLVLYPISKKHCVSNNTQFPPLLCGPTSQATKQNNSDCFGSPFYILYILPRSGKLF